MSKLYPLKGKVQHYAWGGEAYIPNLLNIRAENPPYAEYWLGAHVNAPSVLKSENGEQNLDNFIETNIDSTLGQSIAARFGRLPFLFKVLDVKDMLSIQVHPTKVEAEKGFARENEMGIPLNAPNRNYKDDNHKPEIMVALSEFWLLHGFLPEVDLKAVLNQVPELSYLLKNFENGGYFELYKKVMEQSDEERNQVLRPLIDRILPLYKAGQLDKANPDYWAAKAVDSAEDRSVLDRGIYSIYFFNIVRAEPGQAVFQDAGIPHAYLEGQNMELMANSDNVLRGGLTPKHVDVAELLKHVIFEETHPNIMHGELQPDGLERIYKSPAPDFELSKIDLKSSDRYLSRASTAQILIVLEGEAEVTEGQKKVVLKKGESAFITSNCDYEVISPAPTTTMYKATAP
ncbi:MAG: mannose-6-phosphate isomerase, class I [Reichenbachiella sp.]|uniref:mannose-6-phosphate isomerase, class I n=3 Tax=Reichenbachiella sp. TaxID=2184521 RepID=UPI003263450B